MVTVTLTPDLEHVIVERAARQGTTPELYVLDELRERHLPVTSVGTAATGQPLTLQERRALMKLPVIERRRLLAEQADRMCAHYEEDTRWRELHEGDIVEY